MGATVRTWGTHAEFCQLYEKFLDAVYRTPLAPLTGTGRWKLYRSIASELSARNARLVLDCAAGTGFPALNLAVASGLPDMKIHCTDGDPEMLQVLARRAIERNVKIRDIAPPGRLTIGEDSVEALHLDWADLDEIETDYDYVMCRGNSLAYANTWGGQSIVSSTDLIVKYLRKIAGKVRSGGHLHVDAPWKIELPHERYEAVDNGSVRISEQVNSEADCRFWRVGFDLKKEGKRVIFERFSTLLTIYDVQVMLDDLGFEDTEPFQLPAERAGFGVIIARKP